MTIAQLISFTQPFYDNWDPSLATELTEMFELDLKSKISTLSRGQNSQSSGDNENCTRRFQKVSSQKRLLTLWMVRRAKSLNFVDQTTIRRMVMVWLVAYGFGLTVLAYSDSVVAISKHYDHYWIAFSLIASALASLVVLPIAAVPMAVYWNRHRA